MATNKQASNGKIDLLPGETTLISQYVVEMNRLRQLAGMIQGFVEQSVGLILERNGVTNPTGWALAGDFKSLTRKDLGSQDPPPPTQ